jgi:formate/nitrite transporter FocA (FNT family)
MTYMFGGGAVGATALSIANVKCNLTFVQAVALGMMCNALVCLAVWLSYSGRSTSDKTLAVIAPVTAFVAMFRAQHREHVLRSHCAVDQEWRAGIVLAVDF